MSYNRLKLNTDKTQFIWLGSRLQLRKVAHNDVQLGTHLVHVSPSVNDLGVTIDSQLTMSAHVSRICSLCFYHLRQIRTVRQSLTRDASKTLVHAFVSSRLDYCNSTLYGICGDQFQKLQSVLNAAARMILSLRKYDHVTSAVRDDLHWLPIRQRIEFRICVLVYKYLHGSAPSYLSDMIKRVDSVANLRCHRSASRGDLLVPRAHKVRFGPRSFAISGPTIWNSLPLDVRDHLLTFSTFTSRLKTFLFRKAYVC